MFVNGARGKEKGKMNVIGDVILKCRVGHESEDHKSLISTLNCSQDLTLNTLRYCDDW